MGHSCGTLLWDTLVGHLVRHSCGTLLWVTCRTLLWDTLVGHSCGILLSDTLKSHSRLHFAHSTRTISAEGCARMGQIALSPAFGALDTHDLRRGLCVKSPKRAFRTRLPQKLTRQSLQNERFVRDFLQKSSGNTHRSTHITQPCQAVSRFQPLQTTSAHTPIPMGQRHSPLPQLTTSRFPAPATNLSPSTRLTRTKYCACHEMSPPSHLATSRFPAPATRIALPRFKARTKSCACHEK